MSSTYELGWAERADIGQRSLDHYFGAPSPQFLNNFYPSADEDNATFNYWWLAHLIDVRLDAFERTGDAAWLAAAEQAYANILERNGDSLFNDYFDDMLWLGLAAFRLHSLTGTQEYLGSAIRIWEHVVEYGWNGTFGESLAWRKQQLYYKNMPANGPLIILSCRLHRLSDDERYLVFAKRSFQWVTETLVDAETGFVEDGINREEDGAIDTQWRFTYNQGLYIGAAVELFTISKERSYLDMATRTTASAFVELASDGVFLDEGDGGDEGLFKGVFYRYLRELLSRLDAGEQAGLKELVRLGVTALWDNCFTGHFLLASNDWNSPASGKTPYSTQLSAIMGLELMAWIDVN